jgi:monomeric isocitrate dehydrogenase
MPAKGVVRVMAKGWVLLMEQAVDAKIFLNVPDAPIQDWVTNLP